MRHVFLMWHCALSRHVVNGNMHPPQDVFLALREMALATLHHMVPSVPPLSGPH